MKAFKWNFKKQKYEDYELPENCPLICHDMEKIINCANCREKFNSENAIVVKQFITK